MVRLRTAPHDSFGRSVGPSGSRVSSAVVAVSAMSIAYPIRAGGTEDGAEGVALLRQPKLDLAVALAHGVDRLRRVRRPALHRPVAHVELRAVAWAGDDV